MSEWKRMFAHLTVTAVIVFGGLAILLVLIGINSKYSFLPLILFLCGCCGAVVNNYRRLSVISEQAETLEKALENSMVTIQLYVSPLIGGVLALLLWATFFSGLIQGTFFPKIEGTQGTYTNFHDLMANTHPASFAEAAKGIFWSFVAGYSERFVPNILDRLAEESEHKKETKEADNI